MPTGELPVGNDSVTSVEELKGLVRKFGSERDWDQFHLPKDLGVALAIEVGEVLEHFRYQTDSEIATRLQDPVKLRELSHEFADVFWLLLRLADVCNVDLASSLREKLLLAADKYPIDKVRGKPHKYSHYQ